MPVYPSPEDLERLLKAVAGGDVSAESAAATVGSWLGRSDDVWPDHGRPERTGEPEVVLATGKTPAQCAEAVAALHGGSSPVLVTRADAEHAAAVRGVVPDADYDEAARLVVVPAGEQRAGTPGTVAVATGGTGDLPVARECAGVLGAFGVEVRMVTDVGVTGVHRTLAAARTLTDTDVVVAVAGMEGTLPTVLAGLVSQPVVAVPTSVGYGASFGGVAALLTMLSSCAPGVSVVNIDNGFGAAMVARRILRTRGGAG
ncbi:hypothetical protein CLV30_1276 [Haloactinopolyspora alba]|uniref:PurE domain-containing protein n=1 Tax=Haloactinopolyspora alba TaxID=648780 RepID=A0A2P8DFS2_9ACTN|nr:nickel pincer cofactor biosynthesis protein LarB [Haloactinopolyspora alba]PSK96065.1 hypothetical protein CLV30_1276 [Haloactinopolyspora alba]